MAIRIARNDAGNCINFFGSSNPTYWNAVLEGEINEDNPNNVNVVNTVRTLEQENTVYEFFNLPYTNFVDKDENPFENASECAQYITDNANVLSNQGSFVFSQTDTLDAQVDTTNTTVLFSNGDIYAVNALHAVAAPNGTITIETIRGDVAVYQNIRHYNTTVNNGAISFNTVEAAVDRLNEVLSGSAVGSDSGTSPSDIATSSASGSFTIYGDRITDEGGGRYTSTLEVGNFDTSNGMLSNESITQPGEYFEFSQNTNWDAAGTGFTFGLFDEDTYDQSDLEEDVAGNAVKNVIRLRIKNTNFVFKDPTSAYGKINETGFSDDLKTKLTYRLGLDVDNRAYIGYYDGTQLVKIARTESTLPLGTELKFCVIMPIANDLDGVGNFTVNTITSAPSLTWYYIESPDTSFFYPLFATAEEAEYVDEQYGTASEGNGVSHQHTFGDEQPTQNVWYMPDTYMFHNQSSAPAPLTGVAWNEIATGDDADYVPSQFTATPLTVNENASINYQIKPAGDAATYSVTGIPAGLAFNSVGYLVGNAPEVTSDNVANPSDEYTITVTKANDYGSSVGTLTLVVNNLTAPVVTPITGVTDEGGTALIDSDTMDNGSVISIDEQIGVGQRFVIEKELVETYVLPKITAGTGDKTVFIGFPSASADWASIASTDFYLAYQFYSNDTLRANNNWTLRLIVNGVITQSVSLSGSTNGIYDFIIINAGDEIKAGALTESQGYDATSLVYGTTSPWVWTGGLTGLTEEARDIVIATGGTDMDIDLQYFGEYSEPYPANSILVSEVSETEARFDIGSGPVTADNITLSAGQTYKFYLNNASIESGDALTFETADGTNYTTGVTTVGSHGEYQYYVQFAVPSDVPPIHAVWNGTDQPSINISGSTYVTPISGITQEGPAANQTGSNIANNGAYGWISIDEPLAAGERFVMDNAFFADLLAELPDQYEIIIGIKGPNWDNTDEPPGSGLMTGDVFRGNAQLRIYRSSSNNIYVRAYAGTSSSNQMLINTVTLHGQTCAFLDITSTGNNIRLGFGRNGDLGVTAGAESTTAYANWNSYKIQTGDQGYGITSADVVIVVHDIFNGDNADFDGANVDWTTLSEINIPAPVPQTLTDWDKAVDFSGGSEYLIQTSSSDYSNPINMSRIGAQVAAPTTSGNTSSSTSARPWATAIVFQVDRHNSNQHIWNVGEGSGSTDDNIYLRMDANGQVYFGWGRQGALNECKVVGISSLGQYQWYGVYVAHKGTRWSGSNATANNLADTFDIRVMTSSNGDNFTTLGANQSTSANWTTTGGRMDRGFTGNMTIGGRGGNRNFHGKVASMVVTAIRVGQPMPDATEIKLMVTDPKKWEDDYRVGQTVRNTHSYTNSSWGGSGVVSSGYGNTQIWLMGDGTSDSYSNGIRNEVAPNDQNYTKLQLNSMQSNDIENVSIPGLS